MVTMCLGLLENSRNWINRMRKVNVNNEFLKSHFENDLCPTFLRYKMSSKRLKNKSYRRSQRLFLQEEI